MFTRALLALYGEIPWRGVPAMPVEIMLLPKWFPFHIDKISYWGRTVLVPLLVLQSLKPQAVNRLGVHIGELFMTPPEEVKEWPKGAHQHPALIALFGAIDRVVRAAEPYFPKGPRARAIAAAEAFVDRAAERRRRSGRDLPGHGQQPADV